MGGQIIAVFTESEPAARTNLSMSRWKALSGREVRPETFSRSSYGGCDGASPYVSVSVSFQVRMPVPDV